MGKISTFVTGAAIGCAVGSLAALALTPRNGEEMRKFAAERVSSVTGGAINFGGASGGSVKGKQEDEVSEELRAKIEAARARIAAQVAETAKEEGAAE